LKSNYTVMGEGVGMAVRLESVNRRFGTVIVASQGTVERCAQQFVFRELERVEHRGGKVESVYELMASQRDFKPEQRQILTRYEEALSLFRLRNFEEAAARFETMASADAVSALYVQRCRELLQNAPPPEWDARVVLSQEEETA
jgi:adenylate cyclase